ncbi:MAG: tRNA (adenosine(37)-N6)-threonylcarbamoyltransferase complex transferase subunit TsaD [Candidatus Spechtbacterales bacterium]|nr:tRNA (adenosine(37)-N6)-threonylcarbamoyltransferase complex transferase subunit TsaD [Candidatus Spechtbacterales bacterium]
MKILGIETSCDDTALALLEAEEGTSKVPSFKMLQNIISSQLEAHAEFGGVVPGLAKREHAKNLIPVLYQILEETTEKKQNKTSKDKLKDIEKILERYPKLLEEFKGKVVPLEKPDIDLITVTHGPGLEPALWVGVNFARALAVLWNIPLVGVDHMEGHIAVNLLSAEKVEFPALALAVSGGHTQLILVKNWMDYELLGETLDDAAGEAFDKVARMLGLGFPGGPAIEKLAKKGNANAFDFPRPMLKKPNYNFSFSGLKTAVLYTVQKLSKKELEDKKVDLAASFQQAVVDTLVIKSIKAAKDNDIKTFMLAGGVAANTALREQMEAKLKEELPEARFIVPEITLATDNGVMIAIAGYLRHNAGEDSDWRTLEADSTKLITE